jgi:two-component system chemotaxis response regulator CheB
MERRARILVVDDSALMRRLLRRIVESAGDMEVVGVARDGEEAIEKARSLRPDAITMDVNMPRLDGLTALTAIVEEGIAPVLVVSSLAREGSLTAYEALELGAFDCVEKPGGTISASLDSVREAILSRLRTAAKGTGRRLRRRERLLLPGKRGERAEEEASPPLLPGSDCWGVAIGISTGGPRTIYEVLPLLPADLNAAVFLVQHMPPSFTRMYAERLDQCSLLRVVEAEEGMPVVPGTVFVGQGGRHLKVRRRGEGLRISLELRPRHFFLPSVGVMMDSVLDAFGPRTLGVLMTGMGDDGADAMARIRERGGFGIAESEETAVVFGMPAEAIARGGADLVLPAPRIAGAIRDRVGIRTADPKGEESSCGR